MKVNEIVEKSILVRSVCNELYAAGILNSNSSDGIHCTRELFKNLAHDADSFDIKNRDTSSRPYETVISMHGVDFFAIWEREEIVEAFPSIDINAEIVNIKAE